MWPATPSAAGNTGDPSPGVEVIRQLSGVLRRDLLQGIALPEQLPGNAGNDPDTEAPEDRKDGNAPGQAAAFPTENSAAQTNSGLIVWKILVPVLLLAAVIIAAIVFPKSAPNGGNREYRDPQGVVYRTKDYAAVQPRQEGRPYFSVSRRLDTNESVQMYTFLFTEDQGFPAAVQRVDYVYFNEDRSVSKFSMTARQLAEQGELTDIPAYGTFDFVGGFPVKASIAGVGIELYVTDEKGGMLSFTGYQKIGND